MINEKELPEYLQQTVPELYSVCLNAGCKNPFDIAAQLISYTHEKMQQSNVDAATTCMRLVEKIYKKGSLNIRNAIENVYVYSFTYRFFHNVDEAKKVSLIMPQLLMDLYKKQIIYSHL